MAVIHKPGEEIRVLFPGDEHVPEEDQSFFVLEVPTHSDFKKLMKAAEATEDEDAASRDKFQKRAISLILKDVENLRWAQSPDANGAPPEMFEYERNANGTMAHHCWEVIFRYSPFLEDWFRKLTAITGSESKNY